MSQMEIMLERVTANDEDAVIVAVHMPSGGQVSEGDLIFEFENSKTTQELYAPQTGILLHDLAVGQTVNFGVAIARIAQAGDAPAAVALPASAPELASPTTGIEPRFSFAALALIEQLGLKKSSFTAPFVTSDVIRGANAPKAPANKSWPGKPAVETPKPTRGTPVDFRKRAEIEALSNGAGNSMLSVLGVRIGKLQIKRAAGDFLEGRITDLVIYEASRLMKQFPKLNAHYAEGAVVLHEDIHAGLAIDSGGRLVVYGIEHADRASLQDLSERISDAVEKYLNDSLTAHDLTRATFTVTDLSADDLDFVLPLLPRGQSCILGITHDPHSGFKVFAGFDHRVTEGREISAFLQALRDRLVSFATQETVEAEVAQCGYCSRTAAEAVSKNRDMGLLMIKNAQGRDMLCCASCWNGW